MWCCLFLTIRQNEFQDFFNVVNFLFFFLSASSSAQVKDTQEEYKGLSGIIQTSKNLLNKYNRREVTDRLLIFFGLVLFFSTVLYILKKRLPIFGG